MGMLAFHLALLLTQVPMTQAATMYSVGINGGGYLTRVTFDPSNPSICWVGGDNSGLFKSKDGCQTFTAVRSELWRSDQYGIDDITIDPSNSNIVFALGGEYTEDASGSSTMAVVMGFGFWGSSDGGTTFSPMSPGYPLSAINSTTGVVTYSSKATSYIRNDGRRAERLTIDGIEGQRHVSDGKRIAFDPSSCSSGACETIYVADFKNGIYKSTDGGTIFKQLPLPPIKDYYASTTSSANLRVSSIELVPYGSSYILLVGTRRAHQTYVSTEPVQGELYIGFNGGENALDWLEVTPSLASGVTFEALDISVSSGIDLDSVSATDTTDYFYVAAGKGGILRGHFDAFDATAKSATISWNEPSACSSTSWTTSYDIGLACDPGTSTSTGSTDESTGCPKESTDCIQNKTQTGTYVAVEVHPSDSTGKKLYALGLAQGSVYYSKDGGTNWSSVYDSSKLNYNNSWFNQHSWKFADFATSLAYRYHPTSYTTAQVVFTDWWSTWKSTANGTKSFKAFNSGLRSLVVNDMKLDPYTKTRAYIAVSDHTFFYSTYYGVSGITFAGTGFCSPYDSTTATCKTSGIAQGQGVGVAVEPSSNQSNSSGLAKYVFLATKRTDAAGMGNLYQSEDNGATWTSILPSSFTTGEPAAILYDSNFSGLWLAWYDSSGGSALYKFTQSGTTWSAAAVSDVATSMGATDLFRYATKLYKASSTGTQLFILDQDKGLYVLNTSALTKDYHALTGSTDYPVISSTQCSNNGSTSATCELLSVAVNPSGTIFVGTRGAGAWSSTDSGKSWSQLGSSNAYYTYRNVRAITIPSKDASGRTMFFAGDSDLTDHWSSTYTSDCTCTTTSCTSSSAACTVSGVMFSVDSGTTLKDLTELSCSSSSESPGENWGRSIRSANVSSSNSYFYFFMTGGQGAHLLNLRRLKTYCGLGITY